MTLKLKLFADWVPYPQSGQLIPLGIGIYNQPPPNNPLSQDYNFVGGLCPHPR